MVQDVVYNAGNTRFYANVYDLITIIGVLMGSRFRSKQRHVSAFFRVLDAFVDRLGWNVGNWGRKGIALSRDQLPSTPPSQ